MPRKSSVAHATLALSEDCTGDVFRAIPSDLTGVPNHMVWDASVCLGGAGRQCVWMFGRRPGAPCSDTANPSVPLERVFTRHNPLVSKSGRLSRVITTRSH